MSNDYLKRYKRGVITIEIQSMIPERFVNLLWKSGVRIKNIKKKSITTMTMEINLNDYNNIEDIAKRTKTKIKIVKRKGIAFFLIKLKKRSALVAGIILFIGIIYYLSTFIWHIDIKGDGNVSPYEIRQQLTNIKINPGINKRNVNVYEVEDKLIKSNENIMWVRARIEGSSLRITVAERQAPPNIVADNVPCNLVAKKDGQVIRVYTKAGTAVVKRGDMVKKGQVMVKGEQGKEGETYQVHAVGDVICRTFYEETKKVKINEVKKEKTGNKVENLYVEFKGKKIYLKKSPVKFAKYDKIEDNKLFVKKEIFNEVKEVTIKKEPNQVIKETSEELYNKICANLDKSVTIVDKIINHEEGEVYNIRVVVVAEENIAISEAMQ